MSINGDTYLSAKSSQLAYKILFELRIILIAVKSVLFSADFESDFEEIIAEVKSFYGPQHPQYAKIRIQQLNAGAIYDEKECTSISLDIESILKNHYPTGWIFARLYLACGIGLLSLNNLEKAIDYFKSAGKIVKSMKNAPTLSLQVSNKLGEAYMRLGNFKDAFNSFMEVEKFSIGIIPLKQEVAQGYRKLGEIFFRLGKIDNAIEKFDIALKILKEIYPNHHVKIHSLKLALCEAEYSRGNIIALNIARHFHEEVVHHYNEKKSEEVAEIYGGYGRLYLEAGNLSAAIEYYVLALQALEIHAYVKGDEAIPVALALKLEKNTLEL